MIEKYKYEYKDKLIFYFFMMYVFFIIKKKRQIFEGIYIKKGYCKFLPC